MMKTLKEVGCGQTATVKRLNGEGPVKRRIMDMGITKGTAVYVRKVAPLGDPIEVRVRGYELSLRKRDAEMIEVEKTLSGGTFQAENFFYTVVSENLQMIVATKYNEKKVTNRIKHQKRRRRLWR